MKQSDFFLSLIAWIIVIHMNSNNVFYPANSAELDALGNPLACTSAVFGVFVWCSIISLARWTAMIMFLCSSKSILGHREFVVTLTEMTRILSRPVIQVPSVLSGPLFFQEGLGWQLAMPRTKSQCDFHSSFAPKNCVCVFTNSL